jgi:hypothetical protein
MKWPWTQPSVTSEPPARARDITFRIFEYVLLAAALFFAALFARRNIRAGRGNRQGAWRVGTAAFSLFAISELVQLHAIPSLDVIGYLFENLSQSLAISAILWMGYMALEPAVRARWPHSLITWNRLLAGQFRDSRLGSDILAGAAIAMGILVFLAWRWYLVQSRGGAPGDMDFNLLLGVRPLLASHANTAVQALQAGLAAFFLLSGLRAVARRDWLAALAASILLTLAEGNIRESKSLGLDIPLYVALYFVLTYALLRLGLVTMIAALYCLNTTGRIVIGPEFTTWYNYLGLVQIAAVAAVALYGFWRSQSHTVVPRRI